jgi:uncharacterized protein (TIGR00369 family)
MKVLPHTRSCFVCGESNPVGLKLLFHTDGQIVQTRFTPRPEHIGFKGVVHGGLISTLLDEIMVWACAVRTKRFAFAAEMTVRFKNTARPNEELIATGELATDRRKLFEAKAELRSAAGQLLATATGKYVPVPDTDLTGMARDFVDDPSWILGSGQNDESKGD